MLERFVLATLSLFKHASKRIFVWRSTITPSGCALSLKTKRVCVLHNNVYIERQVVRTCSLSAVRTYYRAKHQSRENNRARAKGGGAGGVKGKKGACELLTLWLPPQTPTVRDARVYVSDLMRMQRRAADEVNNG